MSDLHYMHYSAARPPKVTDDAFCDPPSLALVTGLPESLFVSARREGRALLPYREAPCQGRQMVLPFTTTVEWLLARATPAPSAMMRDLAEMSVKAACWRLARRVVRGTRERTYLAKAALRAYRSKWPDEPDAQPTVAECMANLVLRGKAHRWTAVSYEAVLARIQAGATQSEVARELGLTPSRIYQIVKKARRLTSEKEAQA